jgi:uncharacterized spore protein YtfJ
MIDEKLAQATKTPETLRASIEQVMSQLVTNTSVNTVFGAPVEREGAVVIPCAEITVGMGMGTGSGPVDAQGNSTGSGGGGGGGTRGRPIAAVVITNEGVRVEPIMDITKVALAGLSTAAFILLWFGRLIRADRKGKAPSFRQLRKSIPRS